MGVQRRPLAGRLLSEPGCWVSTEIGQTFEVHL
jgi:hypothetical protein